MKAADVMVANVITVGPDACVKDVAHILLTNRISAVPVVGADGKLLGIVSEGDLLRRTETDTSRRYSWLQMLITGRDTLAAHYVKENSRKVVDVMTKSLVTAMPETPLREIATLLEKHAIKRVPIVRNGKLVGIVSRANLMQALASLPDELEPTGPHDFVLREKIVARIAAEPWARSSLINVIVHDGSVDLWGVVSTPNEKDAVRVAAEITPGVRAVNDNMIIRPADSGY
jgi:CBS domain-containing protein